MKNCVPMKEYLNELDTDIQKLKIREMLERDPKKKADFKKRSKKLSRLRSMLDRRSTATISGKTAVYETAAYTETK